MINISAKHKNGFSVKPLEPFTFPGGEAHIKGFEKLDTDDYEYFIADVRQPKAQDLFHLALLASGLVDRYRETHPGKWDAPYLYVIMPYLPAARADKGIPLGAELYSRFLMEIVDSDQIIFLDPHSKFMSDSLSSTGHEYPFERIIKNVIAHSTGDEFQQDHDYVGVIAPDKGSKDRAERAAAVLHVPVYYAGKTRDQVTGKLSGFHMEDELPSEGKFLLVDDVLDGMGTFLGLAGSIKTSNPQVQLDLWGTHGIFSNEVNLKRASEVFGAIHVTDSYATPESANGAVGRLVRDKKIVIHSITPYLYAEVANLHSTSK